MKTIKIIGIVLISLLGFVAIQTFAATNYIETPIALFSTSLNAPITTASNTMTLTSGLTGDGTTLASSTYSFIIDEGSSNQEFVKADCTNTTCTNMQRGLSMVTGTSTVATNAQVHRRGASVKITDAPLLLNLTSMLSGEDFLPAPITYVPTMTSAKLQANSFNLASVGYVNSIAFSGAGVVNASAGASGVVQLATPLQQASSTALGSSGASLVLAAANATSTFNAVTGGLKAVITGNNGKIDSNFLSGTFTATSTLATTTINGIYPQGLINAPTYITNLNSATTSTFVGRDYLKMIAFGSSTNYSLCMAFNGDYNSADYTLASNIVGSCNGTIPIGGAGFSVGQEDFDAIDAAGASGTPKLINVMTTTWREDTSKFVQATTTALYKNYTNSNAPITSVTIYDAAEGSHTSPSTYLRVYSDTN